MKKLKIKPFTHTLAEKFGGKWTYIARAGMWESDDGVRYVLRVAGMEEDSIARPCMYFRDGRTPVWVNS